MFDDVGRREKVTQAGKTLLHLYDELEPGGQGGGGFMLKEVR